MFSGLHKIDVAQSVRVIKQMTTFVNPARLTKYSFYKGAEWETHVNYYTLLHGVI